MADLPDLDTSQIGVMGFWNALDNGANSVDPTQIISHSRTVSWDDYDNGFDIVWRYPRNGSNQISYSSSTKASITDGQINLRIKTDGWIIVWFDRNQSFQRTVYDFTAQGYYDMMNWWSAPSPDLPSNNLADIVNTVRQVVSDGNETFAAGDVGIYSHEYPDTSNFVLLQDYQTSKGEADGTFSYSDSVTIDYHTAMFSVNGSDEYANGTSASFEGRALSNADYGAHYSATTVADLASSSGVTYSNSISPGTTTRSPQILHLMFQQ